MHCKLTIVIEQTSGHRALLPALLNALPYLTGFGSKTFIEKIKESLEYKAKGRKIIGTDDTFDLHEVLPPYGKADKLNSGNTYFWD